MKINGIIDSAFGTNGVVMHQIGSTRSSSKSILIQGDGKILCGGYYEAPSEYNNLVLTRYLNDGSPDPIFGTSGIVTTNIGSRSCEINAIALQPDGKIVATGFMYNGDDDDGFVIRYNQDGTVDTSFGSYETVYFGRNNDDNGSGIKVDAGGFIYVVGTIENPISTLNDIYLTKLNPDGSVDTTFGVNGEVILDLGQGNNDYASDLVIDKNGKAILCGSTEAADGDIVIMRFNQDGSVDETYGDSGIISNNISNDDYFFSIALQKDDKLIAVGVSDNDILIQRYRNLYSGIDTFLDQKANLSLFPNPAVDNAVLKFDEKETGDATIQIFNLTGEVFENVYFKSNSGSNSLILDFSYLNPGAYILKLKSQSSVRETRFIIE